MRLAALGLGVILALALAFGLSRSDAPKRPAPALPQRVLTGQAVSLAALRGKPALVEFFASWCGPCVAEAGTIARAAHALRGRARLVAVDWTDSRTYALAFVRRFHWSFSVLEDPNGKAGYAYGIQGLPSAFVLDRHGHVVRRLIGPQTLVSLVRAVEQASRT